MLDTELVSQKRHLTSLANGARIRIEQAKNLIKAINEGEIEIVTSKEELIKAQSEASGALENLSDIGRWVMEQIGEDSVVSADQDLEDSYIELFNKACEERNYGGLIKELSDVLEAIELLIEVKSPPYEQWRCPSPTPLDGDTEYKHPEQSQLAILEKSDEAPEKEQTQIEQPSTPPLRRRCTVPKGPTASEVETPILRASQPKMEVDTNPFFNQDQFQLIMATLNDLKLEMGMIKKRQDEIDQVMEDKATHLLPKASSLKSNLAFAPTQKSSVQATPPSSVTDKILEQRTKTIKETSKLQQIKKKHNDLAGEKADINENGAQQHHPVIGYTAVRGDNQKTLYYPKTSDSSNSDDTTTEDRLCKNTNVLKDKMKTKHPRNKIKSPKSGDTTDGYETAATNFIKKPYQNLKLSPFVLPTFSGKDCFQYESWKVMFDRAYGENPRMDNLTRLFYLKQHVSENAKVLLDAVPMAPENYQVALDILERNFKNNIDPLEKLHDEFARYTVNQRDYTAMNLDVNRLATIVFQIKNYGGQVDTPHIYLPFIRKMPQVIKEKMMEKIQNPKFDKTFEMVYTWISQFINTKRNAQALIQVDNTKKVNDFEPVDLEANYTEAGKPEPIGKQLFPTKGGQPGQIGNENKEKCCEMHFNPSDSTNHDPNECYTPPRQAYFIARAKGLCTICFKTGHGWKACSRKDNPKARCQVEGCGGLHATIFHEPLSRFNSNKTAGGQIPQEQYDQFNGYPSNGPNHPLPPNSDPRYGNGPNTNSRVEPGCPQNGNQGYHHQYNQQQ